MKFQLKYPVQTAKVKKVVKENYRVSSFELDCDMPHAMPGQFIMVWLPGVGEKPMSIGNNFPLTISVANVGKVSEAICSMTPGSLISFRGPLGNGFAMPSKAKKILVVGGGYGIVPMYFLSKAAAESKIDAVAVIGGRNIKDIIYEKHLFAVCKEVFATTDDGSGGRKGNVMVELEELLGKGPRAQKFDCVYACGPERMMAAVAKLCAQHRIQCQVSVERYMKCGTGVCGSCVVDGKCTCTDGPVFDGAIALTFSEFGKSHRDASGVKHEY